MKPLLEIAGFAYHDVTDDCTTSGFQRPGAEPFKLTRRAFTRHLARVAAGPVPPQLVTELDWTGGGRSLLLTFDDGGKSALAIADELSHRGWRGHFFIVTSLVGAPTFLDASGIRYLRSCGHIVGSHSHTHPDIFREQTLEQMLEEWRVSSECLADLLGEPCTTASVPGGDISSTVLRSAAASGLRYLFTCEPWLAPRRVEGCQVLGRFVPKVTTPPARISELAHFRGWRRALMVRQLKELARRSLPGLYRRYVRQRTGTGTVR
jgi:peptidoglycan/xylan/chitin deacetylase (PgdA/CDA1 family)